MEFTPVSTHRAVCYFDYTSMRRHPARSEGGRAARLLARFHFMFWCFVAVLCGTLQYTMGEPSPFEARPGLLKSIITMAMMFSLWFVVVLLFWRQWRIIRQLEPTPSRLDYRNRNYTPRNLSRVKVVANLKDSVIY